MRYEHAMATCTVIHMSDLSAPDTAITDGTVEITVPLAAEHAATLRVVVASLGSDHGMNVDEIDDLKLAVSEVFTVLIDDAAAVGATRAHVRYNAAADNIRVELDRGLADDRVQLDVLASTILSSVVDEHVVGPSGVVLVKRTGA